MIPEPVRGTGRHSGVVRRSAAVLGAAHEIVRVLEGLKDFAAKRYALNLACDLTMIDPHKLDNTRPVA